ncbi:MAG: hypothetical protein PUD09_02365 [Coriobacteriales bacterium]|nr:hypothetical protein [Coriobacteriales bacterium]
MQKKEWMLLLSLALVAAVIGATLLGQAIYKSFSQSAQSTDNVERTIIPAGSTWSFNSNDPQNDRVNDQGASYHYELGWSGTMEMTVLGARAYANVDALDGDVPENLAAQMKSGSSNDKRGLLLVTLRQKNIDAASDGTILDSSNNPVLNAYVFYVPNAELVYFSEATHPDNDHDYFVYQLEPGEEKTMVLGYRYGQLDGSTSNQPPTAMTPGFDGQFKPFELQLGTTLVEGES